jgi:hypothetical protein
MAKKIIRFNHTHLRREEQHSFHDRVMQIVLNTCGKCGKAYDRFEAAAIAFDQLLTEKALAPSLSLVELDDIADSAWSSLNLMLRACLVHPRQSVRDAASKVSDIFSKTPNPTMLNYDEEYGALRTLLSQLATLDSETIKAALVDEHIAALQKAVEDFVTASASKVDALSKKQTGLIKAAATECFKAWQDLAKYIEIMASLDSLPGASDAIDQLNALNTGIKRRLEARKSNKASGKEDDAGVNIVEFDDGSKFGVIH